MTVRCRADARRVYDAAVEWLEGHPIQAMAATVTQQRQVTIEEIPGTDGLLSTVRNVEICATGIEYPLASGPMTFTTDDLLQAIAALDDPAIQNPRVWLGHPDDQRFHAGRTTPVGSAEPALGKVINPRVEDDGQVLVGDIAGCPTWLAKILASAYPSRSIEGFKDAKTATGRTWGLVITDLALLGVSWPGVSTLEDLQSLYSEEGPDNIEVIEEMPVAAAAASVQAQGELDKVRRAFIAQLSDLQIPGYPWIRSVLQDPNELVIDDDEGGLYRLPYDASGEEVVFGKLQSVKIQYVNAEQKRDANARTLLANALTTGLGRTVVASWDTRAASELLANNDQEVSIMDPEKLRTSLGLPADATDEQVEARLEELSALASAGRGNPSAPAVQLPTTPYTPPTTGPTGDDPGSGTPSPDQVPDPNAGDGLTTHASAAQLPQGMIAVPAEAWTAMQASVQSITQDREAAQQQADLGLVADAIRAGKIYPHAKESYEARLKDPQTRDAFRHLLTAPAEQGGLAVDLVPIQARGSDPTVESLANDASAYPTDWLPELAGDGAPAVTMEG